jgi:hypothetical protein
LARIVFGGYMVRYPLGGALAGYLQWPIGLQRLGHDVYVVENAGWRRSCYDPVRRVFSDDCSRGFAAVRSLLERFGLSDRLCFVDADGGYHGLSRSRVREVFDCADLFVDNGTHGNWLEHAANVGVRVLIDGEPGARQMKMQLALEANKPEAEYDHYYTVGQNVGTDASSSPTAGRAWRHLFHPVVVDLFAAENLHRAASYTTVMNWRTHESLEFGDRSYGQKDVEFEKFFDLPARTNATLEVAVSGPGVPTRRLAEAGWVVRDAFEVAATYDAFVDYVAHSRGEFSVCKHVYVATWSGWFSDRSSIYLAAGRPVVLEDTGFSAHLPRGEGLFAVKTVDEAASALEEIERNPARHSRAARELAREYLDADRVLAGLLEEVGL